MANNETADELRIAIIGAGASGLTAAHTLQRLGYSNITIFERDSEVGGKVRTNEYQGHAFEIGAFWIANGYDTVDELAEEYGVSFDYEDAEFVVRNEADQERTFFSYIFDEYNVFQIMESLINLQMVKSKFTSLQEVGFVNAEPDLFLDMATFAKKYHIEAAARAYRPFWIGCGYGYYEEVPALYVLKMMIGVVDTSLPSMLELLLNFHKNNFGLRRANGGFQRLWEKVAADLPDVRLHQEVTDVRRYFDGTGIKIAITAGGHTEIFDRLLISSNLYAAMEFLDETPEEASLFSRIQSYSYYIHQFHATDIPYADDAMIFVTRNNVPETIGHFTAMISRSTVPGFWTTGQLVPWNTPVQDVVDLVSQDVQEIGGSLSSLVVQQPWNYFPHVKTTDLQQGFYQRLEALQGLNGTYFIGGLMNFEIVENTALHAKTLVHEFF